MVINQLKSLIDDWKFVIFHWIVHVHMKSMKIERYWWKSMVIDVINKDFAVIID